MTGTPLVALAGIAKQFDDAGAGAPVQVLRDVDLTVAAGESVAIVGPSGCGKSTLLDLIGGLQEPTAGTVVFDGVDLSSLDVDALAAFRNREVGYVFQAHHLLPQCTALENVLVPTLVDSDASRRAGAGERAMKLLTRVGLAERVHHRPAQLSGGERQRVAVVRALIQSPRLLLADEPTGALDGDAADSLGDLLAELNGSEGVALLTVTHSPALASRMARTFELCDGVLRDMTANSL